MSMEWPVRPEWLSKVAEAPLDPGLPIVDAHHHLWKLPHETYLLPELLADLRPPSGGHNIVATVFAECGAMYRTEGPPELRSLGEVEFANGVAAQSASGAFGPTRVCAAIFGSVDLMLGREAGRVMDAHIARAPDRYRGVRPIVAADPHGVLDPWPSAPDGMMASDAFRDGARELAGRGLSLDIWVFHHQLAEVAAVAAAVPDLTIILDLPIEVARGRRGLRRDGGLDPAEATRDFAAIREGLVAVAHEDPRRCHVVDANQTPGAVARDIWDIIEHLL